MTDQRVGRHVRIYEWDEVDSDEDLPQVEAADKGVASAHNQDKEKKAPETPKGLSGLLKRKLF
ncbi:hypothetical protein [Deinococcus sp.]|uniref:hypothetical protein n=1 Tax=Deinococcus sp. TaxID=47478 RepID=UPI0025B84ADC|nr:hypothetical protein [Deinococcus sp.]